MFRYESFTTDPERGLLTCHYSLDGRHFTERITLAPSAAAWATEAAQAAARLVFLLAGVSYYKTAAPGVIDLGPTALTDAELAFLREFYLQGLGEFAYRNHLDLTPLRIEARRAKETPGQGNPTADAQRRALVPFGGGIDSIVVVERVRRLADAALFVVSRPADRFDAIEAPAAVTGLAHRAGRAGDRPAVAPLRRARLPKRPRPGDRDPVRDRGAGGGAGKP